MVSLTVLVCAWAYAELGREGVARVVNAYLGRLRQMSPEAAAWGALKDVRLPQHAAHLKELVATRPVDADVYDVFIDLRSRSAPPRGRRPTARLAPGRRESPIRGRRG